jgi:hypothetical protein
VSFVIGFETLKLDLFLPPFQCPQSPHQPHQKGDHNGDDLDHKEEEEQPLGGA